MCRQELKFAHMRILPIGFIITALFPFAAVAQDVG